MSVTFIMHQETAAKETLTTEITAQKNRAVPVTTRPSPSLITRLQAGFRGAGGIQPLSPHPIPDPFYPSNPG